MMSIFKTVFILLLLCVLPLQGALSDTLRVSQIDNTSLLANQRIRVYVSVTGEGGVPVTGLDKDAFRLYESTAEGPRLQREILRMLEGVNVIQGVNFLLIIDNSGSMYWDETGRIKNSDDPEIWRITSAKEAVEDLLNEIRNPRDRVGLMSFNMRIDTNVQPTDDKVAVQRALAQIGRPPEEEAFTELYETIYRAVGDLSETKGRKVVIVLSDGVDFPMKDNPYFPDRAGIDGVIDLANREGISIFTIGLGRRADNASLSRIAQETGGAHFSTYSPEEISRLYALIRDQILNEYLLVYAAGMRPAEKKLVRVEYTPPAGDRTRASERYYFSETVFGFPREHLPLISFIAVPAAVLVLLILALVKFERRKQTPSLEMYQGKGRGKKVQTLALSPRKRTITIGGGERDDLTITGDRKVSKTMVQIDTRDGSYRLTSSGGPVTVNNRNVQTRMLKSGDVIKVGDTTVVFDAGTAKKEKKK
jgi:Mg-chelatase subunit ChlD